MGTLAELSLFSGYGGLSLGLRLAGIKVRTVCYVENEAYCQKIIKVRAAEGHLDDAPLWDDVRTFDGQPWRGCVDIITAGFPCQPHSVAGQRRGEADERNLWPDTLRIIGEVGPGFVLLENVPGILVEPGYAGTVVGQLAGIGYDAVWHCVPAAAVGAPHLRWRWWCLAYPTGSGLTEQARQHEAMGRHQQSDGDGQDGDVADTDSERCIRPTQQQCTKQVISSSTYGQDGALADSEHQSDTPKRGQRATPTSEGAGRRYDRGGGDGDARRQVPVRGTGGDTLVADTQCQGLERQSLSETRSVQSSKGSSVGDTNRGRLQEQREPEPGESSRAEPQYPGWWAVEPDVGRVAHGITHRVDRLRALGNGIVPAVVAKFLKG